jgi:hypothetical protein
MQCTCQDITTIYSCILKKFDIDIQIGPCTGQIIIIDCLKEMRIVMLKKGCKSNGTGESVRNKILTHSVSGFDYAVEER